LFLYFHQNHSRMNSLKIRLERENLR
jgi:hypothetical protein